MLRLSSSLSSTTSNRLRCGVMKFRIRSKQDSKSLGRDRLDHVGEGAVGQPVLPLLFERNDLNGNVPGLRIQLEVVQDCPPKHVGQEDVEGNRSRDVFEREIQRLFSSRRHDAFESLVPSQPQQDPRIVRIVFDDEDRKLAVLYGVPVVGDFFFADHGQDRQRRRLAWDAMARPSDGRSAARRTRCTPAADTR